jgi:hypothetical protein
LRRRADRAAADGLGIRSTGHRRSALISSAGPRLGSAMARRPGLSGLVIDLAVRSDAGIARGWFAVLLRPAGQASTHAAGAAQIVSGSSRTARVGERVSPLLASRLPD